MKRKFSEENDTLQIREQRKEIKLTSHYLYCKPEKKWDGIFNGLED